MGLPVALNEGFMGRKKIEDWSEKDTEIIETMELEEDVELLNELEEETEVTKKSTKKAKAKSKKTKEPTAEDLDSEITQIFEEPKEIDFSEEIEEEVRPSKADKKTEKKKEEKKPAPVAAAVPVELPVSSETAPLGQSWNEVAEASKLTSANLQKISGELKELLNQVRIPASRPSPMAKIAVGLSGLAMVFSLLSLNFSQSVRYAFFEQQRMQAETIAHTRQVREQREQHRASTIQVERPNSEVAKALPEARINKLKATTPKSKKN